MNRIIQPSPSLTSWVFDNSFTRELPGDPNQVNSRRQVKGACYSRVQPQKVSQPELVAYSQEMATSLQLLQDCCESQYFAELMAGNQQLPGMDPHAMCYGGHQFGNWAGQLGDGRAINLGELLIEGDHRYTLQLKGAGPTPYSRTADGLAVLRSSIREFLCSEAMFHLGVPTTRALSLVRTGELVERDMFYDGHPQDEPGAIVCRVAPSFLRFGNFELLASRGETELLRQVMDYSIVHNFNHLGKPSQEVYHEWFAELCRTTAEMIVHWMRVGFVHGVMNTDNMSILGLTIDYGPYGWLEGFDTKWTPNTTDAHGRRYCFGNQPHIGQWNLVQLANALYTIMPDEKRLQDGLTAFSHTFQDGWNGMLASKLGLKRYEGAGDDSLFDRLFGVLSAVEVDYTLFFRNLAHVSSDTTTQDILPLIAPLKEAFYDQTVLAGRYLHDLGDWLHLYHKRIASQEWSAEERLRKMNCTNPKYVFRNYLAQTAIEKAEEGNYSEVIKLLELLRHPYEEQPEKLHYAKRRPEWARSKAGCSMLSCSS